MHDAGMLAARTDTAPLPGRLPTVELLDQALLAAKAAGFSVRHEWLGGSGGGPCEIRGSKWLFVDLALSPTEQLDQVLEAIASAPDIDPRALPVALRAVLARRALE